MFYYRHFASEIRIKYYCILQIQFHFLKKIIEGLFPFCINLWQEHCILCDKRQSKVKFCELIQNIYLKTVVNKLFLKVDHALFQNAQLVFIEETCIPKACHKVFTNHRIFTFNNTLIKSSSCIADIICITQITCKRVNKASLIHGWRLHFSYPEKYKLPIKEQKRPETSLLEGHKQRHKRHNQVVRHKPRTTEQPTNGVPQTDRISTWHTVETDFFSNWGYFLIITD